MDQWRRRWEIVNSRISDSTKELAENTHYELPVDNELDSWIEKTSRTEFSVDLDSYLRDDMMSLGAPTQKLGYAIGIHQFDNSENISKNHGRVADPNAPEKPVVPKTVLRKKQFAKIFRDEA